MKYPRIYHLPWSPGGTRDDKRLASVDSLLKTPLVVTEKVDGSNVCLTRDALFARSHTGPPSHASFDLLKAIHARVKHRITPGIFLFGEWAYATHSIPYTDLPAYLLIFGVCDGEYWWNWQRTVQVAQGLGLAMVPMVEAGRSYTTAKELRERTDALACQLSLCGGQREGLVVRLPHNFDTRCFTTSIAKWVRADHVQTDAHWTRQAVRVNGLAGMTS